jgi:hypothetical protein
VRGNTLFITRIIVASVNVISSTILNFMCAYMRTFLLVTFFREVPAR